MSRASPAYGPRCSACPACQAAHQPPSLPRTGSFLDQQPLLQRLVPDEQHGHAFELPAINPNYAGQAYRCARVGLQGGAAAHSGLIRALPPLTVSLPTHAECNLPCCPPRYVYGACCVRPTNCWNALCKLDTATGEVRCVLRHRSGGSMRVVCRPTVVQRGPGSCHAVLHLRSPHTCTGPGTSQAAQPGSPYLYPGPGRGQRTTAVC
jgi:hypothetical protein